MRKLTTSAAVFAAESLAIAYSHLHTSTILAREGDPAGAVARLYYAAFHAAKATLADLGRRSNKHTYWVGKFNESFGKGTGWIPVRYVRLLNELKELREAHDYHGTVPEDKSLAAAKLKAVAALLSKIRKSTPLVHYPDFIKEFVADNPNLLALEFDYYCPKSYLHKERLQFQVKAEKIRGRYLSRLIVGGKIAIKTLSASREEDYVLGWNSRLGQSADGYLLFFDIDETDEGAVKRALSSRPGWLFKSGEGYHFIAERTLPSEKEWRRRLSEAARSKKLKNLIDQRHVDFSLRRGYSTLRVTRSLIKTFEPFLCWENS